MGKFNRIRGQLREYIKERAYFEHYLANCVFILLGPGKNVVDYKLISHGNKILNHGFARILGNSPLENISQN